MRPRHLLIALLTSSLPLLAQSWEASAMYSSLKGRVQEGDPLIDDKLDPGTPKGLAVRIGKDLTTLGALTVQISGTYHFKSSVQDYKVAGETVPNLSYEASYLAAGISLGVKSQLIASVGIDFRKETLGLSQDSYSVSADLSRIWAVGRLGYSFPAPSLKPFIALEFATPLSKKTGYSADPSTQLQSLAPASEFGIVGGIYF